MQRESTTVRRLRREVARLIMLPPPNKASTPGASWPIESYPLEMRSSVVTGALVRDWFQAEGALVARFDLEVSKVFEPIVSLPVKIRDGVVHLVTTLGSAVISARAELGRIIASALPVATLLTSGGVPPAVERPLHLLKQGFGF